MRRSGSSLLIPLKVENPALFPLIELKAGGSDEVWVSLFYPFEHRSNGSVFHQAVQKDEFKGDTLPPVDGLPVAENQRNLSMLQKGPQPLLPNEKGAAGTEQDDPILEPVLHQAGQVLQAQLLIATKQNPARLTVEGKIQDTVASVDFG